MILTASATRSGRRRALRTIATFAAGIFLPVLRAQAMAEIGEPAPPLRGRRLDGTPFDLARMRGKVVLLNFYSTYCKFCAYEIGTLETVYENWHERGLEVLVLSIDDVAERERSVRMLGIYGLPGAMVGELEENGFGASHPTPTCYIVDRQGVVRARRWGAKSGHHYREEVLPLLGES